MSYDPETGELAVGEATDGCQMCAGYASALDAATTDLKGAERELRAWRRKFTALENEMREQRNESPEGQTVKTLGAYWVRATGRDPKRTKLGDARWKKVLARLRDGYEPEYIMRAIDAAAAAPAVSSQEAEREALVMALRRACELLSAEQAADVRKLYASLAKSIVKYDDLELICRDEVHLERFYAKAARMGLDTQPPVE